MARALACLGDKTSYGEIISATASWFEGSKAMARTPTKAGTAKVRIHGGLGGRMLSKSGEFDKTYTITIKDSEGSS